MFYRYIIMKIIVHCSTYYYSMVSFYDQSSFTLRLERA